MPVLIVDGPAEEGKYLAKSQNGKGGEAEEAGYTREAGPCPPPMCFPAQLKLFVGETT